MKNRLFKKGLILGIILLFVGAGIIPSTVGIIEKKSSISNPCSRGYIQDLIDNASDGDTIYIPSGIYYENIVIDKSINLIGEDKNTTIIDGGQIGDVVQVLADWVNMSRFTIQNSGHWGYAGIQIYSNHNNFIDNNISSNGYIGIRLYSSVCNNSITGNILSFNSYKAIILLDSSNNNIISDNIILRNDGGINLDGFLNIVTDNVISLNWNYGIMLMSCENTITSNTFIDNYIGIRFIDSPNNNIISNNSFLKDGLYIGDSSHNYILNNTINGKPLIHLLNKSDEVVIDAGQVILVNCNNITVKNQNFYDVIVGVELINTHNCLISDINFTGCGTGNCGIISIDSSNINILNNYLLKVGGIYCLNNSNNIIDGNNISNCFDGIYFFESSNNLVTNNNIINSSQGGISMASYGGPAGNNTIVGNNISDNYFGIAAYSENNIIYHNNFINNSVFNANCWYKQIWDDGKYGNYWSDYEERYPDAKPKIFKPWMWDTPYEISGEDNKDMCPLVKQWPNSASSDITRDKAFNNPILNFLQFNPNLFPLL